MKQFVNLKFEFHREKSNKIKLTSLTRNRILKSRRLSTKQFVEDIFPPLYLPRVGDVPTTPVFFPQNIHVTRHTADEDDLAGDLTFIKS